jgi:GGDEF domain-containing protein
VTQLGYRLVYEPEAVVYNRGASTVSDFLRQRRRIYTGHLSVRRQQGYKASTMSVLRILRVLAGSGSFATPRTALWTAGAISLEGLARGLGHYDHLRRRSHQVWETALTTKQDISEADRHANQCVLVFNIVNLHRLRLEFGLRISRQLISRVTRHIARSLGPNARVSFAEGGTIVVLLQTDREEAERTAQRLMGELREDRFLSHQHDINVQFACGIIAFSQTGQTQADSIPASALASIEPVVA